MTDGRDIHPLARFMPICEFAVDFGNVAPRLWLPGTGDASNPQGCIMNSGH